MSNPVFLILLLTVIVGSVHSLIMIAVISGLMVLISLEEVDASLPFVVTYYLITLVLVFWILGRYLLWTT